MNCERIGRRTSRRRLYVQSLEKRNLLAGDVGMTNAANPFDVNGDDAVSPADALGVINTLARMQSGAEGEAISSESGLMPDTNGDGLITPSDALGVINALEAESEETTSTEVPMDGTVRKFEVRQGSTTVIEFEGDNVRGEVTVMSDGTVRLVGGGISETLAVEAPENIRLRVVGHHNTLIVRGVEIRNDVIIDVDGNQNHFALIDSRIGDDLIYLGAEGVDRVLLDNTDIGDSFQFHGRKLDDALVMRNDTRIGGDFIYHGHRGHDLLYADGVSVGDDAIVRMGDGDDVGAVRNVAVNDVANLHAQGDFDLAAIGGADFAARRLIQNGFEGEISFSEVESIVNTYVDQILGPQLA